MHKLTRVLLFATVIVLILSCFGCSATSSREISVDEIVDAYEDVDCEVWVGSYDVRENGSTGYIQANFEDGEYIYFEFFKDRECAEAHARQIDHPLPLFFFSLLSGEPTWQTVRTHGNICITYFNDSHYRPFANLIG